MEKFGRQFAITIAVAICGVQGGKIDFAPE